MSPPPRAPVRRALLLACLSVGPLAGCQRPYEDTSVVAYLPRPDELLRLGRVVLVEPGYDGPYPHLPRQVTQALVRAIHERGLFQVSVVGREEPSLKELSLDLDGRKTVRDLALLRRALGVDTALLGQIRHFEPYPRMQLALCLQLVDLKRGRLVWGIEHTWDTSDYGTELRIQEFYRRRMGEELGPLDWRLARVSPNAFHRFVACEVAATLTARTPAAPARASPPPAHAGQQQL